LFSYIRNIIELKKQLFPTGRAFKVAENGYLDNLLYALALSENVAYNDALSIQNSILPDNDEFTAEDAKDWERRLGLITNEATSLADRKAAILRKMNHPGTIKARQHWLYMQSQLQAANFPVYVYENRFPNGSGGYDTRSVFDVIGDAGVVGFQHNDKQHGDAQHGGAYPNIVVNYIDEELDRSFYVVNNLRSTFFIGGSTLGSFANIPASRKDEFRQLVLKLKATQMVGYLLVNYV